MYFLPIHVPIYTAGDRRMVTTEWHRSLELLRDSLQGRYGTIVVLAPSLPADASSVEQSLQELTEANDGIRLTGSFDPRGRARDYWLKDRRRWLADLREHVPAADVVHAALDDVYRPICYDGFLEGVRGERPTLFVQDTDIVLQMGELAAGRGPKEVAKAWTYGRFYERMCRRGVRLADLSLLKGSTLIRRYGESARNARCFQDTSHSAADVVPEPTLERRLEGLTAGEVRRLVYCGRLVRRKGIDQSIHLIRRLRDRGVAVEFDVIGDGPELAALERLAAESGLAGVVRFLGRASYGPELLRTLAGYDGLLFTPLAEDTPRMIFDGFAAGLPLIAWDIEYVRERAAEDAAVVPLPKGDLEASADRAAEALRSPRRLDDLARRARRAGEYHAAENWYRRRAEWTFEAVSRHRTAKAHASRPMALRPPPPVEDAASSQRFEYHSGLR
ncbi:glycosyltransferase [Paludisphaera mucosa]|uniref:Glycosyltransferase n=1 Tax=Paludisphaera mucosa TaxID=3030827 RepID=A0ABT6FD89_9BACT|nr:glycosyltransferase [Paludisphaera mucosa]MDG3005353.1 glycosyltransferase [Paludisphaera mucosa]